MCRKTTTRPPFSRWSSVFVFQPCIERVLKTFDYYSGAWEPQFVADQSMPFHDEHFPYRLRSNTQLVDHLQMPVGQLLQSAELCRAGYTFTIVNDLFSVHRGFKRRLSSGELNMMALWRRKNVYHEVLKQFQLRLDIQYPATRKQCPSLHP